MNARWALLAEDDILFAKLFERFWRERYPGVELVTVSSVTQARRELKEGASEPAVVVLDLNLKDGTADVLTAELECPFIVWSACSEAGHENKPRGREELVKAVVKIGRLGGLDLPQ